MCNHCERCPAVTPYGLCGRCDTFKRVRLLYLPKGRDDHDDPLVRYRRRMERVLRRRANLRLPLFPR